jgi:hypothetical protein
MLHTVGLFLVYPEYRAARFTADSFVPRDCVLRYVAQTSVKYFVYVIFYLYIANIPYCWMTKIGELGAALAVTSNRRKLHT